MPIKKPQALPKTLLQALKDYYNKYFSRYNSRNACINRRGYWQMLAVVLPYHILVVNIADYLDRNLDSSHSFNFQSLISLPYFIPSCLLLLFYPVIIALFWVILSHRCRDIGISRWYTLLVFVSPINIAFLIILGCLEKDSAEKYHLRKNKKTDR